MRGLIEQSSGLTDMSRRILGVMHRDEAATQAEVLQLSRRRYHVDPTVTRRKQPGRTPGDPPDAPKGEGNPQGKPDGRRESAEGIVGGLSGKVSEALQCRKTEQRIGRAV